MTLQHVQVNLVLRLLGMIVCIVAGCILYMLLLGALVTCWFHLLACNVVFEVICLSLNAL